MNQTTISKSVATEVLSALSIRTHTINYINSTCRAASQRHNNILNLKNVDLLLVIGDKHSNNANQLVDLAQKKNIDTKIIQFKTDVTKQMLKGIKHLAIASATSVSSEEVKKIINYVKTTTIK
jgi:4-hydroxy-3-methylbut-2-enyl diphosphate reductase